MNPNPPPSGTQASSAGVVGAAKASKSILGGFLGLYSKYVCPITCTSSAPADRAMTVPTALASFFFCAKSTRTFTYRVMVCMHE